MKTLVILIWSIFFMQTLPTFAQDTPYSSKSFEPSSVKNLIMETSGGNLSAEGGTSNGKAVIEMYIKGHNGNKNLSKEEIAERLEKYTITIDQEGDKIVAKAKPKKSGWNNSEWRNGISISFRAIVPKNVNSNLNTSGGNISITNFTGNERISTSGGNIDAKNISGNLEGSTSGGNISFSECDEVISLSTSGGNIGGSNSNGKIDLSTSGGNISLRNLKGKIKGGTSGGNVSGQDLNGETDLSTSGGNVIVNNFIGALNASTSGGSIDLDIQKLTGTLNVSNSGGNARVKMPFNVGYDLDLDADRINMASTYKDLSGRINIGKNNGHDNVNAKMNGGGHIVKIDIGSGALKLSDRN